MPISHKHRAIFVHIPKTGGASIEYALGLIDDSNDKNTENREILHGWIDKSSTDLKSYGFISPVLQHLGIRDLKKILPGDIFRDYFKFAIVRNPWDRMVSNYHFAGKLSFSGYSNHSFSEFLKDLNPFLKQEQCDFILDENGEPGVDFVGRFENLEQDFQTIAKKLNISGITLPVRNRTKHKHYSYYYTDETRELVADLFKNDIKMFGYKFEKPNLIHELKRKFKRFYRMGR